jgi:uncharacterized protein
MLERFFASLLYTIMDSAPYVIMGYFIAALIREFLPANALSRWMGAAGIMPLLRALGAGLILPICSCGVIPLGVGLVRCGAARGTTIAFMAAAPVLSPVAILLGLRLLGPVMMALLVGFVLVGGLVMGLFGNWLLKAEGRTNQVPTNSVRQTKLKKGFQHKEECMVVNPHIPLKKRFSRAGKWAAFDLGAEVSLDLLFGLVLASLMLSVIPASWISGWLGGAGLLPILFVILLSLPIYTCSVPSLPVVRNLILLGASPGVAVAYLIAGPSTNLGELAVILRGMGAKTLCVYVFGLIMIAVIGGWVANYAFASMIVLPEAAIATNLNWGTAAGAIAHQKSFLDALWGRSVLELLSASLLSFILVVGSFKKLRLLFVNPCKHCQFWNEVSNDAACPGACWLKKTQRKLRRIFRPSIVLSDHK